MVTVLDVYDVFTGDCSIRISVTKLSYWLTAWAVDTGSTSKFDVFQRRTTL